MATFQYAGAPMTARPSISGDIRRPTRPAQVRGRLPLPAGMPARRHTVPAAPVRPARTHAAPRSRRKVWEYAQYPLIAIVALTAAASSTLGQILILIYAVIVLFIRRQSSRLSFGLALVILLAVPLFQIIGQSGIAENAAIYVYELLVVGTIGAILELKTTKVSSE